MAAPRLLFIKHVSSQHHSKLCICELPSLTSIPTLPIAVRNEKSKKGYHSISTAKHLASKENPLCSGPMAQPGLRPPSLARDFGGLKGHPMLQNSSTTAPATEYDPLGYNQLQQKQYLSWHVSRHPTKPTSSGPWRQAAITDHECKII